MGPSRDTPGPVWTSTHLFCLLTVPADLVTRITAFCVFFFSLLQKPLLSCLA